MSESEIANIIDYLANAIDRDSDEEMIEFLSESFGLSKDLAEKVLRAFLLEFQRTPVITEADAFELVKEQVC